MCRIVDLMRFLNDRVLGNAVPIVLFFSGMLYMIYLKAFPFRHPLTVCGAMLKGHIASEKGKTSPFRAVTLALGGTLGVGNLIGVSNAILLGGHGAVFWMVVSAVVAMLLKYAETVLALRYRRTETDGTRRGGAMYYIKACFSGIGLGRVGTVLAGGFAVLCIADSFTMGSIIQMHAVGSAFHGIFSWSPTVLGIVLALITLGVIFGGGRRISALTERLVPFMTVVYLILSCSVLIIRRDALPSVLGAVWKDAFSFKSAVSGAGGFLITRAMRYGTLRGLMSNEAGCGTSPIAHAESDTDSPVTQGFWGIFEVFADTVLLCTLTAAVVLVSYDGISQEAGDSMMITVKAYSTVLGDWCEPILAVLVLFFAFATVICRAHYGQSALYYLTKRRAVRNLYLILFSCSVFLGTVSAPDAVWVLADFSLSLMTLLNLIVLWMMRREVKEETFCFLQKERNRIPKRRSLIKFTKNSRSL